MYAPGGVRSLKELKRRDTRKLLKQEAYKPKENKDVRTPGIRRRSDTRKAEACSDRCICMDDDR